MTLPERIDRIRRYGIAVSDDGFFATPDGPVHIDDSDLGRALLAHDELLAACKAAAEELPFAGVRALPTLRIVLAAIALAEGGVE